MQPGVPFALLGAVQLLAMAGWVGLAVAAVARRGRRAPGLALPVLLAGSVLLVVVDGRTALGFDRATDDDLAVLRAVGLLVLGLGLGLGALRDGPRERHRAAPAEPRVLSVVALPGVVVPLAAGPGPALLGGAAGLVAAAACLRARRDAVGAVLAAGLVAAGAAAATAAQADGETGAVLVLLLRGASALLLLAALSLLARASLLSKVVGAILGGVLVMAVAAVGVVGTVVVDAYDQQDRDLVTDAADTRVGELLAFSSDRLGAAAVLTSPGVCRLNPRNATPTPVEVNCRQALKVLRSQREFVVRVSTTEGPQLVAQQDGADLIGIELLDLGGVDEVQQALGAACTPGLPPGKPVALLTRLTGSSLVALVITPEPCAATGRVEGALIYGARIDHAYAEGVRSGEYSFSVLVDDRITASNASDNDQRDVLDAALRVGADRGIDGDGITVAADGLQPTLRFVPIKDPAGLTTAVVAVGRDSSSARDAQQDALRYLVGTALLTTVLLGGLALLLGRRTVQPVRALTAAAEQVTAGDLSVRAASGARDEVGTLSRAFDTMTSSLSAVNEDLRTSAERLRTILTSVTEGLVATDAEGRITSINPAALAMAGVADEAAAVGVPLSEALTVRTAAGEPLPVGEPLRDADAEVVRVDGTTTTVRVEVVALAGADGGVVVVLRDTSRDREVERMKTEFLSNVSHELRTPLTPIRGYADLLTNRKGLRPEQVATFAGTILSESLKMNRVVDLLVDVAAIEAGRVHTSPRDVSVAALLDERLAAWRARAPERAGDLRRRVARGLPTVHVDPAWIGKALDELVDNALKHTPPGTGVTLAATAGPAGRVRVSVADRGPGIAEADQALLFTSFEQVDGSATRRVGGLGLGLSFVSRLAEHGGYPLSVVSAPGRGAAFSLDLPVGAAPAARPRVGRRATAVRGAAGATRARASRAAPRRGQEPGPGR